MHIQFIKCSFSEIEKYRTDYFLSLPQTQELFLEMKVRESQPFVIKYLDEAAGYLCVTPSGELSEWYLKPEQEKVALLIFRKAIQDFKFATLWCKSFDRSLLSLCMDMGLKYEVAGFLFRDQKSSPPFNTLEVRLAVTNDLLTVAAMDDGLFESEAEITTCIEKEQMFCFMQKDDFIGVGLLQEVLPGLGFYDLGMLVNPNFRNLGYGTQIIQCLSAKCREMGGKPQCGCAVDNMASRKTLEKAGFITRDRMLNYTV